MEHIFSKGGGDVMFVRFSLRQRVITPREYQQPVKFTVNDKIISL